MGFLEEGEPFDWQTSRENGSMEWVRRHGIEQFLSMWEKVKSIDNDDLKWGDEIEYHLFVLDEDAGTVRCSLRGKEALAELRRREQSSPQDDSEGGDFDGGCSWVPEYGSWMVEGTPSRPYSGFATDLLKVERNMRKRRARLLAVLKPDEICPTVPCFPLLGVGQFTEPAAAPGGPIAKSLFIPDEAINPHPRFGALTGNIRARRGSNVDIRMPIYQDSNMPAISSPPGGPPPKSVAEADAMGDMYMDAMAFGMGCCCLQVTFQCREVDESRHLYDQLAVLAPIFLALTAATPYARGRLLDTDSRWGIISQSVDDRTPAEHQAPPSSAKTKTKSPVPASGSKASFMQPDPAGLYHPAMAAGGRSSQIKSRYDSISLYICSELAQKHASCSAALNDIHAPYDDGAYERLCSAGIDKMLARHVAHLFSRDPLVIFNGRSTELNDAESTEHFENLQSTNWQTVRWKPPPASSKRLGGDADIGWRVEFRSMEVQLTDFENAAFTVFIVLASRVILYFDLNLYLPLSKVDENMRRAETRDALREQKFWFSQSLMPVCSDCPGTTNHASKSAPGTRGKRSRKMARDKISGLFGAGELAQSEYSVLEILQGKESYRGLVPMILAYLDMIGTDSVTLQTVSGYLDFIVARAAGELLTPAAWMREYIRSHPDYKFDSVLSSRIAADLMAKCHRMGQGIEKVPELHGQFPIKPVHAKDAYSALLLSNMPLERSASSMGRVVERYAQRSELMARKRKLHGELEERRIQLAKKEAELLSVEAELSRYNRPSSDSLFDLPSGSLMP